jgi:hypothetical protein
MNVGAKFTKWGLGLFIFGVFLTLGPILHYLVGPQHDNGEMFMHNITLWWGCPWTLSVAVTQIGGLGMVAVGLTRLVTGRLASNAAPDEGPGRFFAGSVQHRPYNSDHSFADHYRYVPHHE